MFNGIKNAVTTVMAGDVKRLDSELWTVYAVGTSVIRIDLRMNKITDRLQAGKTEGLEELLEAAEGQGLF